MMMKKHVSMMIILTVTLIGVLNFPTVMKGQNDLLSEYEQKLNLVEKQFADFKKQIDPDKMSTMDVKMKVGSFENNRNSLKAKLKELRKSTSPLSETDKGDLDKRFKSLFLEFEELKKLTE